MSETYMDEILPVQSINQSKTKIKYRCRVDVHVPELVQP